MKKILLFILCFFSIFAKAQEVKNILFVGNSLTFWDSRSNPDFPYYNNMPEVLQKMIDEKKMKVHIEKVTYSGASLTNHATFIGTDNENEIFRRAISTETPSTVKKILNKNWDIVVLQEGTMSVINPGVSHYSTEPALFFLDSIIKQVHGKTVLYQGFANQIYQGYGEKKFAIKNCVHIDSFGFAFKNFAFSPDEDGKILGIDTIFCTDSFNTSSEEFHALQIEYNNLAQKVNADVVEIGLAFEKCKKRYPEIKLYYTLDDNHPSKEGIYLIACMFYGYITGEALHLKYTAGLDQNVAKKLQTIANNIYSSKKNATVKKEKTIISKSN